MPPRKDFSEGVSRFYQGWLLRDASIQESQGHSAKSPKSEDSSKDTATPGLAPTQPASIAETSQKSPAVATETVAVKYDPSLPFALQAKPTVATKATRKSSVAFKTVSEKPPSPPNSQRTLSSVYTQHFD
jgi:hypothetical protein